MDEHHTIENMAARSALLRLLTTDPDPNALCHALVRGPMATFGAFAASLRAPDPAEEALDLIGQWGFGEPLTVFGSIPMGVSFPVTQCFATGQPLFLSPDDVRESYPVMVAGMEEVLVKAGVDASEVTIVTMPMQFQGVSIGVCSWWCRYVGPWSWHDYSFVDGIAASLALWLQLRNQRRMLEATGVLGSARTRRMAVLTDRQRAVLLLVREGKSNDQIAHALGYSVSTVKNDVQSLFSLLGATGRKELAHRAEVAGLFREASDEAP